MPAKPNNYLVQLRAQIAKTFSLEELRELAFDLRLDWDELEGSRKTTRIQDLITQLARNGRLAELIYFLRKKRPRSVWPKAPSPEQQKTDIRTAFPKPPLYQRAWFWGISIIFVGIIGISLTTWLGGQTSNQIDQSAATIIAANPTHTAVPTPTITPTPSPTQLPIDPQAEGETLIVIGTFYQNEGVPDIGAHNEIWRAINSKIDELQIENVRVEVEPNVRIPSTGRTEDRERAKQLLGEQYNASLIIWGQNSGIRTEVNFINLKDEEFEGAESTISETERSLLANPDAYSQFVIEGLTNQQVFLSLYSLAHAEYTRSNYEKSLELLDAAISELVNISELDASNLPLDSAYFRLGWLYYKNNQFSEAIAAYTQAINFNPEYFKAIGNRGIVYYAQRNYELALADYTRAININPEYVAAIGNRGSVYGTQGNYELALADLSLAISLDPDFFVLYHNRGIVYVRNGDFSQAINDFNQAISLNPEIATSFYYRANAFDQIQDYERAVVDFHQYLELTKESESQSVIERRAAVEKRISEIEALIEN